MTALLALAEFLVIALLVWWLRSARQEVSELRRAHKRVVEALNAREPTSAVIRQANILPVAETLPRLEIVRGCKAVATATARGITDRPVLTVTSMACASALVIATVVGTPQDSESLALTPSSRLTAPILLPALPATVDTPVPIRPAVPTPRSGADPIRVAEEPPSTSAETRTDTSCCTAESTLTVNTHAETSPVALRPDPPAATQNPQETVEPRSRHAERRSHHTADQRLARWRAVANARSERRDDDGESGSERSSFERRHADQRDEDGRSTHRKSTRHQDKDDDHNGKRSRR